MSKRTVDRTARWRLVKTMAFMLLGLLAANAAGSSYAARVHSMAPADGYVGTTAVWIYFDYPTSVECSPPVACYAKSQWIHAYVSCRTRSVALIQQISMDLNGNVVAVVTSDDPPTFVRHYERRPAYRPDASLRVLESVCGYPREPD